LTFEKQAGGPSLEVKLGMLDTVNERTPPARAKN
jgi:hypothetical protein